MQVYRLSRDKVLTVLADKVDRLARDQSTFDKAPDTLLRTFYRVYDEGPAADHMEIQGESAEEQKSLWVRRRVVLATLATWLDPAWAEALQEHLGLTA